MKAAVRLTRILKAFAIGLSLLLLTLVAFQNCSKSFQTSSSISGGGQTGNSVATTSVQVSPTFCPYDQLTGTTPNDTCVQAAINYACSPANSPSGNAAGQLVFSTGKYYLKSGVTVPKACAGLQLVGQGYGAPNSLIPLPSQGTFIISDNNCTGPLINFFADATQNYVNGGGVSNMGFFNNVLSGASQSGSTSCLYPLIQVNFGQVMQFENLYAWQPYQFIKLVSGREYLIDTVYLDETLQDSPGLFEFTGSGAHPDSTGQLTRQDKVVVRNVMATAGNTLPKSGHQLSNGFWWHGFSSAFETDNTVMENVNTALQVDCTEPGVPANLQAAEIGSCPGYGIFNDFETEAGGSNIINIIDAQSIYFNYLYASCLNGCNNNLHVNNSQFTATSAVSISAGQINNANASCIDYSATQLSVQGVHFFGCNVANKGFSDITIETPINNAASGNTNISNNTFCSGASNNSIGEVAINVMAGNDYVVVNGNSFEGCSAGVVGSVGAHGSVTGNVGP